MNPAYRDLLRLAARIAPGDEAGVAKEYLDEACAEYAGELLEGGEDPYAVAEQVDADLTALADDPAVNPRALAHLRASLLANFDLRPRAAPKAKATPKPAAPRPKIEAETEAEVEPEVETRSRRNLLIPAIPVIVLALVVGAAFAVKYANEITITRPIDTHDGIVQRAHALRKVVASGGLEAGQDSGTLAAIYNWPTAPLEGERSGATELSEQLLKLSRSLAKDGCGVAAGTESAAREARPTGKEKFLDGVARDLIAQNGKWTTKPSTTLRDTVRAYQCPNRTSRPQTGLSQ